MASVLTVNTSAAQAGQATPGSGIDKRPSAVPLSVRAPGPMHGGLGSGVVGDSIGNQRVHGGDDQAVYAYAREDLDAWQVRLDRELTNGMFGENLTTAGIDVTGSLIGERWAVGQDGLVLEVSAPRIPCKTFADWLGEPGWIKRFTATGAPGTYLRVVEPGTVRAGDTIEVVTKPSHTVTVGTVFRALMSEPELLGSLSVADALPAEIKEQIKRRAGTSAG